MVGNFQVLVLSRRTLKHAEADERNILIAQTLVHERHLPHEKIPPANQNSSLRLLTQAEVSIFQCLAPDPYGHRFVRAVGGNPL